jgi:hypothetical protein
MGDRVERPQDSDLSWLVSKSGDQKKYRQGQLWHCRSDRKQIGIAEIMSRRDTMRDPFFSGILLEIERTLHQADRLSTARGLTLTDSNVRSLLVRAINEAKGKTAKSSAGAVASAKDLFLAEALQQLALVRAAIVEAVAQDDGLVAHVPLPAADWIASLEAIKDSCAIRTGSEPGSRGYLEFLRSFITQTVGAR